MIEHLIYTNHRRDYHILLLYVSVVPHITDAIQEWVERVSRVPVDGDNATPDVCIIEVNQQVNYWYYLS